MASSASPGSVPVGPPPALVAAAAAEAAAAAVGATADYTPFPAASADSDRLADATGVADSPQRYAAVADG